MIDRSFVQGTVEYLDIVVSADVSLTGTVEFSLDRGETWIEATWTGSAGLTRTARYLLDTSAVDKDVYDVRVRLADTPEQPVIEAGLIEIT